MKSVLLVSLLLLGIVAFSLNANRGIEDDLVRLSQYNVATFAGGCFWCMEASFESVEGVVEVISGYTGGYVVNPTYEQVSRGGTGHLEAVQVFFDPNIVSYIELLDVFWRSIDPTDDGGQFFDRGDQYKTAIFYHDVEQMRLAISSRDDLEQSGRFDKPIVSGIIEFSEFYRAEEYHQDYYMKNVLRYELYSNASGRKTFMEKIWGK